MATRAPELVASNTLRTKWLPIAKKFLVRVKEFETNRMQLHADMAFGSDFSRAVVTNSPASFKHVLPPGEEMPELSKEEKGSLEFNPANKNKEAAHGETKKDKPKDLGLPPDKRKRIEAKAIEYRAARRHLLKQLPLESQKYFALIGEEHFDRALMTSVSQFIQTIGDKPYRVMTLSSDKSDAWVLGKLLKNSIDFKPKGNAGLSTPHDKYRATNGYDYLHLEAANIEISQSFSRISSDTAPSHFEQYQPDLVVVDDAAYSGNQLFGDPSMSLGCQLEELKDTRVHGKSFTRLSDHGRPIPRLTIHVIVPFTSVQAREQFNQCASRFRQHFDMKLYTAENIAHADYFKGMPDGVEHLSLFAHKIADQDSLGNKAALQRSGSNAFYKSKEAKTWTYTKGDRPDWPFKSKP